MIKITKFGGSSLADANQFKKVKDIILADEARKFVVPSAPGKRDKNDEKVTDLLYKCYALASAEQDTTEVFTLSPDEQIKSPKSHCIHCWLC